MADEQAEVGAVPLLGGLSGHRRAACARCAGLPFGLGLVAVMLAAQQAQNELLRFQETNTTLTVPVETIYMNHGFLVWMFLFAWALRACRSGGSGGLGALPSPLDPVRRFARHATRTWSRSGLVLRIVLLEWCMFVPNVAWTMGVERVLPTLSIARR